MARFIGFLGLLTMLLIAWLLSTNRRAIRWRTVFWGLGLEWLFAVIVLRSAIGESALAIAGEAINKVLAYAFAGSTFVFGDLAAAHSSFGSIFAFQVLPTIIFVSATFALCGFANLGSIGVQIGGIGVLIPNRRNELARLGFRALLAGTMTNLMSASIVGILLR